MVLNDTERARPALASHEGALALPRCNVIRKLKDGRYRLYSVKKNPRTGRRRNLGTFPTRAKALAHERAVQYFKHRG